MNELSNTIVIGPISSLRIYSDNELIGFLCHRITRDIVDRCLAKQIETLRELCEAC